MFISVKWLILTCISKQGSSQAGSHNPVLYDGFCGILTARIRKSAGCLAGPARQTKQRDVMMLSHVPISAASGYRSRCQCFLGNICKSNCHRPIANTRIRRGYACRRGTIMTSRPWRMGVQLPITCLVRLPGGSISAQSPPFLPVSCWFSVGSLTKAIASGHTLTNDDVPALLFCGGLATKDQNFVF